MSISTDEDFSRLAGGTAFGIEFRGRVAAAFELSGGPRLRFLSVGVADWFPLSAESALANIVA
jgi:hypothetical protein